MTDTSYDESPALKVIVLVRLSVEVLGWAVTDNVVPPIPEVRDILSQEASHEAVQERFDVTTSVLPPPADVKEIDVDETLNTGAAPDCVTKTSYLVLLTMKVIVPVRLSV